MKENEHHENRLIPCVARQRIQQALSIWVCMLWQWWPIISCLSCCECCWVGALFIKLTRCSGVAQCLMGVWWKWIILVIAMSPTYSVSIKNKSIPPAMFIPSGSLLELTGITWHAIYGTTNLSSIALYYTFYYVFWVIKLPSWLQFSLKGFCQIVLHTFHHEVYYLVSSSLCSPFNSTTLSQNKPEDVPSSFCWTHNDLIHTSWRAVKQHLDKPIHEAHKWYILLWTLSTQRNYKLFNVIKRIHIWKYFCCEISQYMRHDKYLWVHNFSTVWMIVCPDFWLILQVFLP